MCLRWSNATKNDAVKSSLENYDANVDFLVKWGMVTEKLPASDLVTNELIDDSNRFDAAAIVAQAKAEKP